LAAGLVSVFSSSDSDSDSDSLDDESELDSELEEDDELESEDSALADCFFRTLVALADLVVDLAIVKMKDEKIR